MSHLMLQAANNTADASRILYMPATLLNAMLYPCYDHAMTMLHPCRCYDQTAMSHLMLQAANNTADASRILYMPATLLNAMLYPCYDHATPIQVYDQTAMSPSECFKAANNTADRSGRIPILPATLLSHCSHHAMTMLHPFRCYDQTAMSHLMLQAANSTADASRILYVPATLLNAMPSDGNRCGNDMYDWKKGHLLIHFAGVLSASLQSSLPINFPLPSPYEHS
eukprot:gene29798-7433_t